MQNAVPAPLTVTDNRTGKSYEIPIKDGAIAALDLRQIKTGPADFGLMAYDPAFMGGVTVAAGDVNADGRPDLITAAGLLIFAIVYWVFAAAPSATVLYVMMAFYGIYYALTQPVMKAIVVDNVPREMRGRAFGLFYFVTSIAALLASVITGALWKEFGPALPFHLSAVLALISAVRTSSLFVGRARPTSRCSGYCRVVKFTRWGLELVMSPRLAR